MTAHQPRLRLLHLAEGPAEPIAFDALFRRYAPFVAGVAARLLGRDDHEVDDVVQDVFWIASRRLATIYSFDAAKPWLVTVTVRRVRRLLRRRAWRQLLRVQPDPANLPAPGATPEEFALLARVYRVLDTLPTEDRLAWVLRHVEGERLEDVAHACECSLATAKRRIAEVHEALRGVLTDD